MRNIALKILKLNCVLLVGHALAAGQKDTTPIKIMAFSDFNVDTSGTYNSATKQAVSQMVQAKPNLILGVGDYIDGEKTSLSSSTYTRMWNSFTTSILNTIKNAKIPFLPSPGNHDAYYTNERTHYKNFWVKNKAAIQYIDQSNFPFYYSYKVNDVFFVSLDDARYGALYNRTTQLNWLTQQLKSTAATTARARIVYGHIPLYSVASKSANSSTVYSNGALTNERLSYSKFSLEAVLLDNKVDLVIFGHSHAYYAGEYTYADGRELNVISLPCAGGTQRYLVTTNIKSRYGYVEININSKNELSYQLYDYLGKAQSTLAYPSSITLSSSPRVRYFKK